MKHLLRRLLILGMILSIGLAACTSAEPTPAPEPTEAPVEEPMEEPTEEPMEEEMEEPTEEPMEEPTEEPMEEEMDEEMDVMDELSTIGDIAMADDQFSILVDAVLATGLDAALQGDGPLTVFAPTNDAFAKLPEGTLDSLTEEQLTEILLYHVVEGEVYAEDVMGMDMGTSMLGEDFTVMVDGDTVMINDATIVAADIQASNGVIHVIDTVLLPPSMMMAEEEMDDDMMDEGMMMMPSVIYATSNPADLENDAIYGLTPDLSEAFLTFDGFAEGVTSVESIAFAADGTAYLTVDTADGGSLVGVPDLGNMSESMMLADGEMMMMDGLAAPKGLQVVDELGLVLVADFGGNAIAVYDRDLNLLGTVTNLGEGERSVWDVHHDVDSDTLYATGTDGVLLVYEGFASAMGVDGPTKTIVPADADGNQISVNLHGIAYYAANDELILTDVGDAGSAEDGQLFVIAGASMAEGNTTVSVQIGGPQSMLGNPVDVVYDGAYAYVAEKSNDVVLRFDDLLSMDMMGMMGDAAPSLMIEVAKAESVALPADSMMSEGMMDEGMMDEGMMMMPNVIYATANPADLENDAIYGLTPDLSEAFLTFDGFAEGVTSVESIDFAADGTAYLTVDTADGGALVGVPDLGNMAESMMLADGEMMMMDGLAAPKGLQVVDELGLVLVADFGGNAIAVYDRDLTLLGTVTDLGEGERSVWDVYHDVDSDTLYATGTDGVLLVYDGFASAMGVDGPTRTIVPADADGNQISVNLHGIAYYAANDELILTDVGDAGSAEDGQLFVIAGASMAEGNTTVSVQIGGPESMLGNPVDVVYDGVYAYVAEKSNDAVLRFDDLLSMDMMGMMGDAAPSLMIEVLKAESVALPADSMMSDGMMDG